MMRLATSVLTLAALAAACTTPGAARVADAPLSTPATVPVVTATALQTPSAPPAKPTEPRPVATKGEARPRGLLVVRRGNEACLVAPTNPAVDRKLWSADQWEFVGAIDKADGLAFFFVERIGTPQRYVGVRLKVLRSGIVTSLFDFEGVPAEWFHWSAALSPDGVSIAYIDGVGLHVRSLVTGDGDLWVLPLIADEIAAVLPG